MIVRKSLLCICGLQEVSEKTFIICIKNAALMVTSTTTAATKTCLLLTSPLIRANSDTARSKSLRTDSAAPAYTGILFYIISELFLFRRVQYHSVMLHVIATN